MTRPDTPPSQVRSVLGTAAGRENVMRAWSSSLWRDVPFGAIQLAIFEGLKTRAPPSARTPWPRRGFCPRPRGALL